MKTFINSRLAAFFFSLTVSIANAACDVQVFSSNNGSVNATDMIWSGCGLVNQSSGIQGALNKVAVNGGGSVKVTHNYPVYVSSPLIVSANVMLHGDQAIAPYGITFVPQSLNASQYVILLSGLAAQIWNIKIDGTQPGYPLNATGVFVQSFAGSNKLTHIFIQSARNVAVVVANSPNVELNYVSATLDAAPSAGIWCKSSPKLNISYAKLSAYTVWMTGYPTVDGVNYPNGAADLVSISGCDNSIVAHSTLEYTNTAGIYARPEGTSSSARISGLTLRNNDINNTRQHGIDLDRVINSTIVTNRISNSGHANISLFKSSGNTFRYNTIQSALQSLSWQQHSRANFSLFSGSNNNLVADNQIYGSSLMGSTVHFSDPSDISQFQTSSVNNVVSGNSIWRGSVGYFSGSTGSNTTSPNALY